MLVVLLKRWEGPRRLRAVVVCAAAVLLLRSAPASRRPCALVVRKQAMRRGRQR